MLRIGETQTERFPRDAYPKSILPVSHNLPGRSHVSCVSCASPVLEGNMVLMIRAKTVDRGFTTARGGLNRFTVFSVCGTKSLVGILRTGNSNYDTRVTLLRVGIA